MSLTHTLCNPSPVDVAFPYDKGVKIRIPADGEIEVSIDQMNDFLPGKPGSEEVKHLLDHYGIFLLDTNRSYDVQALEALKSSYRSKKAQYDAFLDRMRRGAPGPIDPELMEETIQRANYGTIRETIKKLKNRIDHMEKVVANDPTRGQIKETLDPERTCFVTQPPRTFPSKSAMEMFLGDNPGIKAEHDAYWKQVKEAKKEKKAASE